MKSYRTASKKFWRNVIAFSKNKPHLKNQWQKPSGLALAFLSVLACFLWSQLQKVETKVSMQELLQQKGWLPIENPCSNPVQQGAYLLENDESNFELFFDGKYAWVHETKKGENSGQCEQIQNLSHIQEI